MDGRYPRFSSPWQPKQWGNWAGCDASQNFQERQQLRPNDRQARQGFKSPSLEVQQYLGTTTNIDNRFSNVDLQARDKQVVPNHSSAKYCNVCEKMFKNIASLNTHLQSHTKCMFPNCSFVASKQTLKLHEVQCHREGKLQIVLDTPEQIAKWREQRRRNYPTLSNVTKKQEIQNQKVESGQTVTEKKFRYNNKQGWRHQRGKRVHHRKGFGKNNQVSNETDAVGKPLENKHEKDIEKESENAFLVKGALGALSDIYGACSSDEDGDKTKEHLEKDIMDKSEQPSLAHESKEEQSIVTHGHENIRKRKRREKVKKETEKDKFAKRRRPSLLQMLLASDIRHERNVLLQCIRYIVKKDFFGAGSDHNGNSVHI